MKQAGHRIHTLHDLLTHGIWQSNPQRQEVGWVLQELGKGREKGRCGLKGPKFQLDKRNQLWSSTVGAVTTLNNSIRHLKTGKRIGLKLFYTHARGDGHVDELDTVTSQRMSEHLTVHSSCR